MIHYDVLSEDAINRINGRLGIAHSEQSTWLTREFNRLQAELAARNVLQSGFAVSQFVEVFEKVYERVAQTAFETTVDFIEDGKIPYSIRLEQQFKSILRRNLPENQAPAVASITSIVPNAVGIESMLSRARGKALSKAIADIELYLESLKARLPTPEALAKQKGTQRLTRLFLGLSIIGFLASMFWFYKEPDNPETYVALVLSLSGIVGSLIQLNH